MLRWIHVDKSSFVLRCSLAAGIQFRESWTLTFLQPTIHQLQQIQSNDTTFNDEAANLGEMLVFHYATDVLVLRHEPGETPVP